MSEQHIRRFRPSPDGLLRWSDAELVAEALRGGGLAALPTETGYMLAARATDRAALERAFAAKDRPLTLPMHVACASPRMARDFSAASPLGLRLLGAFTPGPLTVVERQNDRLPADLVTLDRTVGLRIPDAPATLQVIDALGEPVTATSLNRSGEETRSLDTGLASLVSLEHLAAAVDVGTCARHAAASTLVRVTGPELEVVREGPVSLAEVRAVADRAGSV